MLTRAGPEIGVASTKAFTTQLAALGMLVVALAKHHGADAEREHKLVTPADRAASLIDKTLALDPVIEKLAKRFADKQHALFLGRGALHPIAMEGALKLKEISYIHAEAYAAGELKHGPLALVDADMPVITVAPNNDLLEKLKSNLQEVRARGGELIVFADPESGISPSDGVTVIHMPRHVTLFPGAGRLHDAAAAAGLPRGHPEGHGRRPAAQPRQERHGRVARTSRSFDRPAWHRSRACATRMRIGAAAGTKEQAERALEKNRRAARGAAGQALRGWRHAVLVVLQGIDGAGKDGTIRHVMTAFNPQGCTRHLVQGAERGRAAPRLICGASTRTCRAAARSASSTARTTRMCWSCASTGSCREQVWKARYEQINEFERMLTDSDVHIVKFFLHISKDEQKKRLQARIDDPRQALEVRSRRPRQAQPMGRVSRRPSKRR